MNTTKTTKSNIFRAPVSGLERCPGEAHQNGHIDHCGLCLNHQWGFRPVTLKVKTVAKAREILAQGFVLPVSECSDEVVLAATDIQFVWTKPGTNEGVIASV